MMVTRVFKLLAGTSILAVGVFAVLNGRLSPVSSETFINARLINVRAPAAGTLSIDDFVFGQMISRGDVLAEISLPSPGDGAREGLQHLRVEQSALEEQIDALEKLGSDKQRQAASYQSGRVHHLEAKIAEARANVVLAQEKERIAAAQRERQEILYSRNYIAKAPLVSSQSMEASARIERQMIEKRIDALTFELASAKAGTYIGDGYNDTSYSKQRADEITVRVADLKAELTRKRGYVRQAAMRSDAPTQKLASISPDVPMPVSIAPPPTRPVNASVDGRVWRAVANRGDTVNGGDEILQVADCSNLFATLEVSDRSLDAVVVGQPAAFQGNDGSTIKGSVIFASSSDRTYASIIGAALTQRRPEGMRMSVVVALQPDIEQRARCSIGQSGRLVLSSGAADGDAIPGLVRRLANRIAALMGAHV